MKCFVIGGGAAGFFAAINIAKQRRDIEVTIFEMGREVLQKVKISGGGRCNVTHACYDPKELTKYYPRGNKELLGPFTRFCTGDTIDWFESRGVFLKVEQDNRIFPKSNSSQTIIDCFQSEVARLGIQVKYSSKIDSLVKAGEKWQISCNGNTLLADIVIMATGSTKSMWDILSKSGHTIIPPVPSLFTFNIKDKSINALLGVSASFVKINIDNTKYEENGPLLFTHWGLSGPSVLKLSAWAARTLADLEYRFGITINFYPNADKEEVIFILQNIKNENTKKKIHNTNPAAIPIRLWQLLCDKSMITNELTWADLPKIKLQNLVDNLTKWQLKVEGKSTFKEEFVTAGGIDLKEINMKTMESKLLPNLYFAGEIMNIDAVTGGFNFQAAWTTSWIAAQSICNK
jgi:predicted Rossmann fold flavoprotein